MRYFDLDENGRIKGSYSIPQTNKTLYLLSEPPDLNYYRDGVPGENWVLDQDKVAIEQATQAKNTLRILLAQVIGDYGDNITDTVRTIVLNRNIENGTITDPNIVKDFDQYCKDMLDMYGGPQAIMDVLGFNLQALKTYLAPYYEAKK